MMERDGIVRGGREKGLERLVLLTQAEIGLGGRARERLGRYSPRG